MKDNRTNQFHKTVDDSLRDDRIIHILSMPQNDSDESIDIALYNELINSSFELKLKYIEKLKDEALISKLISSLKSDLEKVELLQKVRLNKYLYKVVDTFEDETLKLQYIGEMEESDKIKILQEISDKNLLRFYEKCNLEDEFFVINALKDDQLKEKYLTRFPILIQVWMIKGFKSDELKKKYSVMKKYEGFRALLFSYIEDEDFVVNYFRKNNSTEFKITLLSLVKRESLKSKLESYFDDSVYKFISSSNNPEEKKRILDSLDLNINSDIDESLTIGVELEARGNYSGSLKALEYMLGDWYMHDDDSIPLGLEITSPILKYDLDSMKELYIVCEFLKNNGFYTNSHCGGHIHIGFEYIESIEHLRTLLILYGCTEDIFSVICNRGGSKKRSNTHSYAKSVRKVLESISKLEINYKELSSLKEYLNLIQSKQPNKYYSLNTKNAGSLFKNTIEFRLPNAELDFNELLINIRLVCKMFERSKSLSKSENINEIKIFKSLLTDKKDEVERLNILLELLFDTEEEKEIYKERYKMNRDKSVFKRILNRTTPYIEL